MAPLGSTCIKFTAIYICSMVNFATGVTINSKSHNRKPIAMKNQETKTNLFEMKLHKYGNVNSEQKVPKYMWNLYNSQLHTPSSCATRSYIVYKNNDGKRIYSTCGFKKILTYSLFQSESQPSTSTLESAALHINIHPRLHQTQRHRNLRPMLLVTVADKDSPSKEISTVVYAREDVDIEVTSIVRDWIKNNGDGHLEISVRLLNDHSSRRQGKSCFDLIWTSSLKTTWMDETKCTEDIERELNLEDIKESSMGNTKISEKRVRRSASGNPMKRNMRKVQKGIRPCSLRPMNIDFKEIGWDSWVIAPKGYKAGSCHGKCKFPMQETLNPTNHAVVQGIKYSVDGRGRCPSCVATELKPLTMLYYDYSGNIVLKQYPNMVASSCGCR